MEIHDEITVPGQEARYGETPSWLSPAAGRLIGDAVASVVQYAREVGKPIVIERLDFRRKKAALESESRKYSRMLSSFSYGKVKAYFIGDLSRSERTCASGLFASRARTFCCHCTTAGGGRWNLAPGATSLPDKDAGRSNGRQAHKIATLPSQHTSGYP